MLYHCAILRKSYFRENCLGFGIFGLAFWNFVYSQYIRTVVLREIASNFEIVTFRNILYATMFNFR